MSAERPGFRPALGTPGGPGPWNAAPEGASVALSRPEFGDAGWSFLYRAQDTGYAGTEPAPGQVAAANRRMRFGPTPEARGPFIHAPVWTWEVPLYFWVGGIASGSAFIAVACDVSGDHRSAEIARKVALSAVAPAPLLLIGDLGRPERFLNMLRIFKPRSPMNMGAWCLVAFSGAAGLAVSADLAGRPRVARTVGIVTSVLGSYLGSYTGVLLACTAVPLWARSRAILGPAFVATATATGAAATRLTLSARGLPRTHPTRRALTTLEAAAVLSELALSSVGERRVGDAGDALRSGRPGVYYRAGKGLLVLGLSLRALARTPRAHADEVSSVLVLAGGLAVRYAWVTAGRASAADDETVAATARRRLGEDRVPSLSRDPAPIPDALRRAYGEAIRRISLAIESRVRRQGM